MWTETMKCVSSFSFFIPQVNSTEIEYEFEEITLERVSISDPSNQTVKVK